MFITCQIYSKSYLKTDLMFHQCSSSKYFLYPPGRFGRVIIVAKDNNTNMLRTEVWRELRQLDELVQNMTVTMPNGETFTYKDECARWEGQCFVNDILNLDKIIGEVWFTWYYLNYLSLVVISCVRLCDSLSRNRRRYILLCYFMIIVFLYTTWASSYF